MQNSWRYKVKALLGFKEISFQLLTAKFLSEIEKKKFARTSGDRCG